MVQNSMNFLTISLLLVINSQKINGAEENLLSDDGESANIKVPISQLGVFNPEEFDQILLDPFTDEDQDDSFAKPLSGGQDEIPFEIDTDLHEEQVQNGSAAQNRSEDSQPIKKWPNGVVNIGIHMSNNEYSFENFTIWEQRQIMKWMARLMNVTCVIFKSDIYAADILIFSKERKSCSSSFGRQGGQQFLYLGLNGCFKPVKMVEGSNEPINGQYFPVIAHELLHALGFQHEHNRQDRDENFKIHFEEIKEHFFDQYKIDKRIRQCSHPYDLRSVLHYGPYSASKYGNPTISLRNKHKALHFGTTEYSKWDIYDVNDIYCPEKHVNIIAKKLRSIYPDCGKPYTRRTRTKRWGGTPADKDEFPWVAHVQTYPISKSSPSTRSATFISDRILVTAASALLRSQSTFFGPESIKIHLRDLEKSYNIVDLDFLRKDYIKNVKAIYIHPEFEDRGNRQFENDLAVIELDFPVDLSVYQVQPICLPQKDFNPDKLSDLEREQLHCKMAGWGKTRRKQFTEELHRINLLLYNQDVCKELLGENFINYTNLCTGNFPFFDIEQTACKGDEGASVACQPQESRAYELAGVISWSDSYNDYAYCYRKPWAATNVFPFIFSWMYQLFEENDLFKKIEDKCPGRIQKNFEWSRHTKLVSISKASVPFPVRQYEQCLQMCCDDILCQSINYKRIFPKSCQFLTIGSQCGQAQDEINRKLTNNYEYTFFHYNNCKT